MHMLKYGIRHVACIYCKNKTILFVFNKIMISTPFAKVRGTVRILFKTFSLRMFADVKNMIAKSH